MKPKSTIRVFNEAEVQAGPGVVQGQTLKPLAGDDAHPSERITVRLASFKPGTLEHLHWHLIEVFYYVISGRAIMRDIGGNSYPIGPGSAIYTPPGIAGSHEWEIQEPLQLISIRATTDPEKMIQFTVDKTTQESKIEFDYLIKRNGAQFKKSLY